MSVLENPVPWTLESLAQAMTSWVEDGDEGKLARWLSRELDADGVPLRLGVPDWQHVLEILAAARQQRGDWPSGCAEAIAGLVQAGSRTPRPDAEHQMMAVALVGAGEAMANRLSTGDVDVDDAAELMIALFWHGLRGAPQDHEVGPARQPAS